MGGLKIGVRNVFAYNDSSVPLSFPIFFPSLVP
jgi:hypothetical protein